MYILFCKCQHLNKLLSNFGIILWEHISSFVCFTHLFKGYFSTCIEGERCSQWELNWAATQSLWATAHYQNKSTKSACFSTDRPRLGLGRWMDEIVHSDGWLSVSTEPSTIVTSWLNNFLTFRGSGPHERTTHMNRFVPKWYIQVI